MHTQLIPIYSLLSPSLPLPFQPDTVAPPSSVIAFPVMCALAVLLRNKTRPPKSLGLPILPVGCPALSGSAYFFNPKFVMREGKTPGQMALHMMCLGASLEACILVRWMQAAFEGPSVGNIC